MPTQAALFGAADRDRAQVLGPVRSRQILATAVLTGALVEMHLVVGDTTSR